MVPVPSAGGRACVILIMTTKEMGRASRGLTLISAMAVIGCADEYLLQIPGDDRLRGALLT